MNRSTLPVFGWEDAAAFNVGLLATPPAAVASVVTASRDLLYKGASRSPERRVDVARAAIPLGIDDPASAADA